MQRTFSNILHNFASALHSNIQLKRAKLSHAKKRDGCLTSRALPLYAKSTKGHCVKMFRGQDAGVMGSGLGVDRTMPNPALSVLQDVVSKPPLIFKVSRVTRLRVSSPRCQPAQRSAPLSLGAHKLLPPLRCTFADWRFFLYGLGERSPSPSPFFKKTGRGRHSKSGALLKVCVCCFLFFP